MGVTVNGLGVLRSLGSFGVDCFGLFSDEKEELGIYSKYLIDKRKISDPLCGTEIFTAISELSYKNSLNKPILFPTTDAYADFISRNQNELRREFTIRCPSQELHESFLDKGKTIEICKRHSVPIPKSINIDAHNQLNEVVQDLKYPVIIKPRKTFGINFPGKNFIASEKKQLMDFFHKYPDLIGHTIIQEIINSGDGNIYVTAAYSGRNSKVLWVYVGRKLRQYLPDYGVTCLGQSLHIPYLEDLTRRFLNAIGYCGFSALEFAYEKESGQYYFLELNTRTYYHNQLFADANVDLNKIAFCEMSHLDYKKYQPDFKQKDNVIWIDFKRDIGSSYRKWKRGKINLWSWVSSVLRARSFAYFNVRDLKPFILSSFDLGKRLYMFMQNKGGEKITKGYGRLKSRESVINILFIIDWLGKGYGGGTEKHLANVISRLDKSKFQCLVCAFDGHEGSIAEKIRNAGAEVIKLPVGRFYGIKAFVQLFKLIRVIRGKQIDIVQTFHFKSDTYGVIAAKLAGVPWIISSRRDTGDLKKRRHITLNKMINPFIDQFIMVCDTVGKTHAQREAIPDRKMLTIYNGVDLKQFPFYKKDMVSKWKREVGIDDGKFVIGSVAYFRPEKAYHIFFKGIEKIISEIKNFRVLVLGDGPLKESFEIYCRKKKFNDKVLFCGSVRDISKYISLMDVICLVPNKNEGFSNAILEAMATGKPVIATDVGGNSEAIIDGKTGIIIPPDDSESLAKAILKLYSNPAMRINMGIQGRKRIEEEFTIEKMISKMEGIYMELANGGRR